MPRRAPLLLAVVLAAFTGPATASWGASLRVQPCQIERFPITFRGAAFTPGSPWTGQVSARTVASGVVGSDGRLRGSLRTPVVTRTSGERAFTLSVIDATGVSATARFLASPFSATFSPSRGVAARLRVRFRLFGFLPRRTVYVHYVLAGRPRHTVALGRTSGGCGHLVTRRRRLFPFEARLGRWRLQFDLRRRFSRRARPRFSLIVPIYARAASAPAPAASGVR